MNTALENMINPVPTCSLKSWLCGVQPDENSVHSAFRELSSLYQSFEAKITSYSFAHQQNAFSSKYIRKTVKEDEAVTVYGQKHSRGTEKNQSCIILSIILIHAFSAV